MKFVLSTLFLFLSFLIPLDASYISVNSLTPGQVRFSSRNVEQKISFALKKQDAFYNESTGTYIGKYFDGKSLFPESEALPVVRSPFGLVLVDGHHHALAALKLGLPCVPIKVIDDLSLCDEKTFWVEAEKKGYVYLYDLNGVRQIPTVFSGLEDDPNRYFAAITARKYPENGDITKSTGAEYPLWIKIGKDIPFIEFHISDALRNNGFIYSNDLPDSPSVEYVEAARKILLENPIPGLRLVPERMHYTQVLPSDCS